MFDSHVSPLSVQVFGHQSTVTEVRFVLATEETAFVNEFLRNLVFNPSLLHQAKEFLLIDLPVTLILFVIIQNILSRGKDWRMHIFDSENI